MLSPARAFHLLTLLVWLGAIATASAQVAFPPAEDKLVQQHQLARAEAQAHKDLTGGDELRQLQARARVIALSIAQGKGIPAEFREAHSSGYDAWGIATGHRLRGDYRKALAALDKLPANENLRTAYTILKGYIQLDAAAYGDAENTLAPLEKTVQDVPQLVGIRIGRIWAAAWQSDITKTDSLLSGLAANEAWQKDLRNHPEAWRVAVARAHNLSEKRQEAEARQAWRNGLSAAQKRFRSAAGQIEIMALAGEDPLELGDMKRFQLLSQDVDRALAKRHKQLVKWEKDPKKGPVVPDYARAALAAANLALANDNPEKARDLVNRANRVLRLSGDTTTLYQALAHATYARADMQDNRATVALLYQGEATRGLDTLAPPTSLLRVDAMGLQAHAVAGRFKVDEAVAVYQEAIRTSLTQRQPRTKGHIRLLSGLADVYYTQRNFREAERTLAEVLKQQRLRDGDQSLAVALNADRLGLLNLEEGDYFKATTNLELAFSTIQRVPGDWFLQEAAILEHQAQVMQAKGDFARAEQLYFEAMRIRRKRLGIKDEGTGGSTANLAQLYIKQGRYSDARKLLVQSVTAYERAKRTGEEYTGALSSLADLYMKIGQYQEAEATARKSLDILRTNWKDGSIQVAQGRIQLANVVTAMGRYREAADLLGTALTTYRTTYAGSNINTAKLLTLLATNANLRGKPGEAEILLKDALGQAEGAVGKRHLDYAAMQQQLAQTYIATGRFDEGAALLVEVLATQKALIGDDHPDYLRTEGLQAQMFTLQGNYDAAQRAYNHMLPAWKKALGERHPEYSFYLADYAHLLWQDRDAKKAAKSYDLAMGGLLSLVDRYFPALSEAEKADFWTKISQKLDNYYLFALSQGEGNPAILGQAYDLRLRTKALLLSQSTGLRNRIAASSDEQLKSLFESWQGRREYLAKLYTYSKADLKAQNIKLEDVEREVADLERQLQAKASYFVPGDTLKPTWQAVANTLRAGEAAVEMFRLQAGKLIPADSIIYAALVIDRGSRSPRLVRWKDGTAMEKRYLLSYARGIANRFDDRESYGRYWAPLAEATEGKTKLYLSTDGVFNKISIGALRRPSGNYVMDVADLRLVANTKDLLVTRARNFFDGRSALLVGDPIFAAGSPAGGAASALIPALDGTAREVATIDQKLTADGWQTQILTREQATETLLKQRANPKLLHIATHGFFCPMGESDGVETASVLGISGNQAAQNPLLRSGLLLSGAASTLSGDRVAAASSTTVDDNGVITAFEVMNMDLTNTELVVLSACETGMGEVRNGEGVYGLQRAFAVAGAKAVVMSLWRVNDTVTQSLISSFYQKWVDQKTDIYTAFRAAQMEVRNSFPEPYYWGAFVISGN